MKNLLRFSLFVAVAVAVFALIYAYKKEVKRLQQTAGVTSPATDKKPNTTPAATLVSPTYAYQAGDHLVFGVNYQAQVMIEYLQEKEKGSNFTMELAGELHQRVYKVENGYFVGYLVKQPVLKMSGAAAQDVKAFEEALAQEVYVNMNSLGVIHKWYFPKNVRPALLNNIKSLLLTSQVVLPVKPETKWNTTSESDLNGGYSADYEVAGSATEGVVQIHKQKVQYNTPQQQKLHAIADSRATIGFHSNGYPTAVSFQEKIVTKAMNFSSIGKIWLELRLRQKTSDNINEAVDVKKVEETRYVTASSTGEGQEEFARQSLRRILGNATWKDLSAQLDELKQQDDPRKRFEVFRKLVALMELEPAQIAVVAQKIIDEKTADINVSTLIAALGKLDNPAAQQALAEIIEKRQDNQNILCHAIDSLGCAEKPTPASVNLLRRLYEQQTAEEVHTTASLSLGSMASRLLKNNDPQAESITYDLIKSLQQAPNQQSKIALLESLGNASHPSALSPIKEYLGNEDETIRASAVMALRGIAEPQVDSLLAGKLDAEKSPNVRSSTLQAMTYRAPSRELFAAVSQAIEKESAEDLRIKEAGLLWGMRKQFPQAEGMVRKLSESDSSARVRDAIRGIMLAD